MTAGDKYRTEKTQNDKEAAGYGHLVAFTLLENINIRL